MRLRCLIWVAVGASTKHKTCENTGNIMSKENWESHYVYFLSKHAAITNNRVMEVRFCCRSNRQVGEYKYKKKCKMRGGKKEEGKGGEEEGACQPPASSNYQCEWSVVAGAMGLISALLKETRPCPPVPLGGCWSSIPHYRQPVIFPQPKHTHLNRGKHSRRPSSVITGEP